MRIISKSSVPAFESPISVRWLKISQPKTNKKLEKTKKFRKFIKIRLRNRNLHDGPSEGGGGSEVVVVKGRIRETQPTRLWANHQVIHHPFLLAAPSHGVLLVQVSVHLYQFPFFLFLPLRSAPTNHACTTNFNNLFSLCYAMLIILIPTKLLYPQFLLKMETLTI